MLGTGNAAVTECYNTCFVIDDGGRKLLVDAGGGNGILTQLKRAGIKLNDVRDIIVTHKHIDHILGAVWLVRMICQNMNKGKFDGTVNIYGHDEVVRILSDLCVGLLQESQSKLIGERVFFLESKTEKRTRLSAKTLRFSISVPQRRNSLVLLCRSARIKNSPAAATNRTSKANIPMR